MLYDTVMRFPLLFSLSALALVVASTACTSGDQNDDVVTPPGEENSTEDEIRSLTLTEADNGKTVTITEGQNLSVKLGANPSTGYDWQVVSTDRTFGYPATTHFYSNSDAVGSGGADKFTWKTKSPLSMVGDHHVKMEYKRAWEKNVAPAKTFEFTVKVVAGSCPELAPPAPGFCKNGTIKATKNAAGCTTGFECQQGCGGTTCSSTTACQYCWGHLACIPKGALC